MVFVACVCVEGVGWGGGWGKGEYSVHARCNRTNKAYQHMKGSRGVYTGMLVGG